MIIHLYGVLIASGVVLAYWISQKIQKRLCIKNPIYCQFNLDEIIGWAFIPAVIGARLYHVIDFWSFYKQSLVQVLFVWQGGLAIYGAILGGLLGIIIYCRFKKIKLSSLLAILDLFALSVPIAQAIGRLGNFINQELFGIPSSLPWAIYIKPENRPPEYQNYQYFHPLFLYESLLNLILFLILFNQINKNRKCGYFLSVYMIGYGAIRFLLDFLRIDPWKIGIFTIAQLISLMFIIVGIGLSRKRKFC